MVAQHNTPGEPPRALSREVQAQLETAMRAVAARDPQGEELLVAAVNAAAVEGRANNLRAEELIVALKEIEQRIGNVSARDASTLSEFRVQMVRGLLEAYYKA